MKNKDNEKEKKEFTKQEIDKMIDDFDWIMSGSY
jgi:hypothetical protein